MDLVRQVRSRLMLIYRLSEIVIFKKNILKSYPKFKHRRIAILLKTEPYFLLVRTTQ